MLIRRPAPLRPRENVVPMINVVFLLLIFFLMTAQIAPPEPFEVTLPQTTAPPDAPPAPGTVLHVAADGALAYDGQSGAAALARLADREPGAPLALRADAALPGAELAALLVRLSAAGVSEVALVTVAGP